MSQKEGEQENCIQCNSNLFNFYVTSCNVRCRYVLIFPFPDLLSSFFLLILPAIMNLLRNDELKTNEVLLSWYTVILFKQVDKDSNFNCINGKDFSREAKSVWLISNL
ncbi:hypothetical protein VNO77_13773 [Canavalia gladiata]|uniref:Uncharacterized protein n=1 Tax=Canavalia gladiata TaxID=3824 RepID=A0AAN9QQH0_CANGL